MSPQIEGPDDVPRVISVYPHSGEFLATIKINNRYIEVYGATEAEALANADARLAQELQS